jgi:CheY-like chemotaxis protein
MTTLKGKVALIIEDDISSISVLQQLLKLSEIQSIVIEDTAEVETALDGMERLDVIFLDLEMPQNNGYRVLQTIQASPALSNVPVVAYTTHTSHLNLAKRAGFHSFLGKPLDSKNFTYQLMAILNGEQVWEIP